MRDSLPLRYMRATELIGLGGTVVTVGTWLWMWILHPPGPKCWISNRQDLHAFLGWALFFPAFGPGGMYFIVASFLLFIALVRGELVSAWKAGNNRRVEVGIAVFFSIIPVLAITLYTVLGYLLAAT